MLLGTFSLHPDTAFAINMSEEFLADSAQQDCAPSFPHKASLEGLGSQLCLPDPTLAGSEASEFVDALWIWGFLFIPRKRER